MFNCKTTHNPMMLSKQAKPFVKWAGGKGHLLSQLQELVPSFLQNEEPVTYVEPFVGGGAMLFHILSTYSSVSKVVINDINPDLIMCYRLIKDKPEILIHELQRLQDQYNIKSDEKRNLMYYELRQLYNSRSLCHEKQAALFMFLNHTCFNGLYRVNSKSEFNVPCGRYKSPCICNKDIIMADHALFNRVELSILNGDYKEVIRRIDKDEVTFVYLDPPYMPLSTTSYFKQYSSSPFGETEQIELHNFCAALNDDQICFMLSNSDCKDSNGQSYFERLYHDFRIDRIMARRYINAHTDKRHKLPEIVVRNYVNEVQE